MSLLQDSSLLLTPSAYKEGKLYSVIPSNGNGDFTATRATTATRVNAEGLVDLVPYNTFNYSQEFTQALWTKTAINIAENTTTAPNGTLTADTLSVGIDASNQRHRLFQLKVFEIGTPYTYSVYLKQNQFRWVQIVSQAAFNANAWCSFDLQDGVIGNNGGGYTTQTITDAGNGWWRISVTATAISTANSDIDIVVPTDGTNTSRYPSWQSLSAVDCYYVWGAQLVEGTSARDYLRTETRLNIPRVDYSLGGCPNILLEPQRTNLALQSSSFDSASWTKITTSITANSTTSPSGIVDADTYTGNGASSQKFLFQNASTTSGTTYTLSVYAKKNTNNFLQIAGENATFGVNVWANFNLDTGAVGTVGSLTTARIENVGNGWYRCSITGAATATTFAAAFVMLLVNSATSIRYETNTLNTSVFLWGAQLEAGAYATSYIPTTTASVTRNLDVIQDLGVSSLIGQTEGTIYWEGTLTSGLDDIFYLNRSVANSVLIYKSAINNITFRIYYGAAFLNISAAPSYTGTVRIAAAYKSGDSVMYINGVQVGTSATAFTFTGALNDVVLNNSSFFFGNQTKSVKTAALFTSRLTNQQMSMLTSGIYPTAAAAYASLGLVSESPSCLTSTTTF